MKIEKLVFMLSFLLSATAFAAPPTVRTGKIVLGGRALPVVLSVFENGSFGGRNEEYVSIGTERFQLNSFSADEIDGFRRVVENQGVVLDKSISIYFSRELVDQIRRDPRMIQRAFPNFTTRALAEIRCTGRSNAFIMIGDNLHKPYPLVGNCTELKP